MVRQSLHQFVERLVEFRDAFVLKLLGHLVDVDTEIGRF